MYVCYGCLFVKLVLPFVMLVLLCSNHNVIAAA